MKPTTTTTPTIFNAAWTKKGTAYLFLLFLTPAFASEVVREFRFKNARFVRGGLNEQLLSKAERRLDRDLTNDEIQNQLSEVIRATGEKLVVGVEAPKGYRPGISGQSGILLPNRSRIPMAQIEPGQTILSVDISNGQCVENEVLFVTYYSNSKWREYKNVEDIDSNLQASPHQFVFAFNPGSPSDQVVKLAVIEWARRETLIYKFLVHGLAGQELQTEMLGWETRRSHFYNRQRLYSLILTREPHNFIADDYVMPDDELCHQALE